jgi:hypothetical protein
MLIVYVMRLKWHASFGNLPLLLLLLLLLLLSVLLLLLPLVFGCKRACANTCLPMLRLLSYMHVLPKPNAYLLLRLLLLLLWYFAAGWPLQGRPHPLLLHHLLQLLRCLVAATPTCMAALALTSLTSACWSCFWGDSSGCNSGSWWQPHTLLLLLLLLSFV